MVTAYRKVKQYLKLLGEQRFSCETPIHEIRICPCGYKQGHTPPPESAYTPYVPGDVWCNCEPDSHAWFRFELDVTPEMLKKPLMMQFDGCGIHIMEHPQFIVYLNGKMRQGLDARHTYTYIDEAGHYVVDLYAYTGRTHEKNMLRVTLKNVNVDVEHLWYDIDVPFQTLEFLDENSREYAMTLYHLDAALSLLDLFELGSPAFFASIARAQAYMDEEFYGKYCHEQPTTTLCVGHTHIDCAWKWTLQQTREKVQRSFSTVLELMRRYPSYTFTSSQPLLYQDLKEEAPELYEEVKARVREGRWECEGAMWVEADCNLSSGESLVRQILYGKRFFREEFGVDSRVLWLPDVFGYSAALPQILKKTGVDWFVTSKIGWNDVNGMPYETFRWKGIDGTEVNTYFMTANSIDKQPRRRNTYNADTTPSMTAGTYHRYSQKALTNEVMSTYGYGDGGGGPTPEQIEMILRQEKGIPGIPNTRTGFAGDFLRRMEERMKGKVIPRWQGELYLEYHRGTYTSIAKNKRNNRKSELLYQNAEALACLDRILFGTPFPKAELRRGWEMILTNQFHDIIPGSSIKEVYDQSDKDYAVIRKIGETVAHAVTDRIAKNLDAAKGYVVYNPNSFEASGPVVIDGQTAWVEQIPSKGYACVAAPVFENRVRIDGKTVETDLFRVVFDDSMQIVSLYDKQAEREVLANGAIGNEIRIYPDHPDKYDNWEWQAYSLDCYTALTAVSDVQTVEDGVRRGIRITRPYKNSTLTQTIWFYDSLRRIDFDTVADWHEHHLMVKAAFPVDINADKASYEIQFGTVERPTHKNTSWDVAKFEVCAHKYADLSEGGYGVSLLNDCKYGYDIHDGVMQLSLFKCGTEPNPEADQGEHKFVYALYPHVGTLAESDVAKQAYLLNAPLTACAASGKENNLPDTFSLLSLNCDHVMCETVKEAEEGDDLIIRLYEYKNMKDRVTVTLGFDAESVTLCNMLETAEAEVTLTNRSFTLPISAFEVLTLRVKPAKK